MQKIKDYALALAAMVAGVTMGYVIFGLIIYIDLADLIPCQCKKLR